MVPQEFGPMYVGEMDIKNWITETPCTNSSRRNLSESNISCMIIGHPSSRKNLNEPKWSMMILREKYSEVHIHLIIVISLVL